MCIRPSTIWNAFVGHCGIQALQPIQYAALLNMFLNADKSYLSRIDSGKIAISEFGLSGLYLTRIMPCFVCSSIIPFCSSIIYNDTTNYTPWGKCFIRNWLQDVFAQEAFNAYDLQSIVPANASDSEDIVFLLSAADLEAYVDDLLCTPTGKAMTNGVFKMTKTGKLTCSYWIRKDSTSTYGMYVGAMGGMKDNHNKVMMDDNGVRPAIFLSLDYDQATPGVKMDNVHLHERVTIPDWGTIYFTDLKVQDKLGYFEKGHTGTSERDFDKFYSSGLEAKYVILQVSIVNRGSEPYFVPSNVSVVLEYDNNFQFRGWCYQYNHNNMFSTNTYVNGGDFAKQNLNYVISHDDEYAVAPGKIGYYCFGCTVPNAIVNGQEPLRMIIRIEDKEITFVIR